MPTRKRNPTIGPRARTAATLLLAVGLGVGLALGVNALLGTRIPARPLTRAVRRRPSLHSSRSWLLRAFWRSLSTSSVMRSADACAGCAWVC